MLKSAADEALSRIMGPSTRASPFFTKRRFSTRTIYSSAAVCVLYGTWDWLLVVGETYSQEKWMSS